MGKMGTRLPSFCLNRIRTNVRVRSPSIQTNKQQPNVINPAENNYSSTTIVGEDHQQKPSNDHGVKVTGRKIMIVVDSSNEAKAALQWSLSHTIQGDDKVILLQVLKSSKQATGEEESKKETTPRAYELVHSYKNLCQQKRPEVQFEVGVVEGKEKGPAIVEEARKQEVGLLVLGQKKRSMTWRLVMMWAANRVTGGVVEYCIQNADCMAIAVRRKNKKQGGYLITTKRHKDFWLLA